MAMFSNIWQENRSNKIEINDIDFEVMNHLIRNIHGIRCEADVFTALDMLMAAEKYDITCIQQQIINIVKTKIGEQNVIRVLEVADKLNLEDLKSKALTFIRAGNYSKFYDLNGISNTSKEIILMIAETVVSDRLSKS